MNTEEQLLLGFLGLLAVAGIVVLILLLVKKNGPAKGACCSTTSDPDDKDVCNKVKDANKCGTDATTINCTWNPNGC